VKTGTLLAVGAVALVLLVAAQGDAQETQTDARLQAVVVRAVSVETDPAMLRTFAEKLRAAGYSAQADLVALRADAITPIAARAEVVQAAFGGDATMTFRQAMAR
jgi:hypothetical protein